MNVLNEAKKLNAQFARMSIFGDGPTSDPDQLFDYEAVLKAERVMRGVCKLHSPEYLLLRRAEFIAHLMGRPLSPFYPRWRDYARRIDEVLSELARVEPTYQQLYPENERFLLSRLRAWM